MKLNKQQENIATTMTACFLPSWCLKFPVIQWKHAHILFHDDCKARHFLLCTWLHE